jgi:hypothetical protein
MNDPNVTINEASEFLPKLGFADQVMQNIYKQEHLAYQNRVGNQFISPVFRYALFSLFFLYPIFSGH